MLTTQSTTAASYPPADTLRDNIIEALYSWIRQRPGLDPRNYISDWRDADGRAAYRSDARSITTQLHHARIMLRYIELRPSITGAMLQAALDQSSRLSYSADEGLDYTTGQYWSMEYRAAACRVMASAIWDWLRTDESTGESIREAARRELGATIARRWFS
jgi:hypothetical protein